MRTTNGRQITHSPCTIAPPAHVSRTSIFPEPSYA
jgi:hypothetical protein